MATDFTHLTWLLEAEAAEYCRCSLWAFRKMGIPAKNSGGRKVYSRASLDEVIEGRDWTRSLRGGAAAPQTSSRRPELGDRLTAVRLRPYKPRKKSTPTTP
jgi:hypothetical protein